MNFERLVQRTAATLLMSMICLISLAQSRTVSGVVLDSRGDPVIGANIRVVSDASIGTITDLDGKFSLAVPGTAKQLEISFIGMQTQTVSIVAGQPVHVTLAEDAEILDEVVVIGYQTVKRKDLTGSVASVSGEQIAAMPVANAAQALQGKLAGVNVTTQDGRPDAAVSIRVRGGGSISQSNDPLVLIDGVSGSLSDIPGDQIESIDVLKDASSTAICVCPFLLGCYNRIIKPWAKLFFRLWWSLCGGHLFNEGTPHNDATFLRVSRWQTFLFIIATQRKAV